MADLRRVKLMRGNESTRNTVVPEQGEQISTIDELKVYLGDGIKTGGYVVNADNTIAICENQANVSTKHSLAWWIAWFNGEDATIRIPKGTHDILTNMTVPSNICLKFDKGAFFNIASGVTLTVNSDIDAGIWEVYTGDGTVNGTAYHPTRPEMPTPEYTDDSDRIATTAFVKDVFENSPVLDGIPTAPTASTGTNTTQIATTEFVKSEIDSVLAVADVLTYKGTIGVGGTVTSLPTSDYKIGWTYKVITAGTYSGYTCEIGDMITCIVDFNITPNNSDWTVIQSNLDGVVIGPASAINNHIATFNGTTGKLIKDSGYTIETSVPSGALFTDTVYTHPTSGVGAGTYKSVTVNVNGHVTEGTNPTTLSGYGITDAAPLDSPALTGIPTAPTATLGTNTNQIATTEFVIDNITNLFNNSSKTFISTDLQVDFNISDIYVDNYFNFSVYRNGILQSLGIDYTLDTTTDNEKITMVENCDADEIIIVMFNSKTTNVSTIPASPTLTGTPTAPTAVAGTNSNQIATTAYADALVAESITDGVTGIAPSQDVVFDALALKADITNAYNTIAVWPDQTDATKKHSLAWWIAHFNGEEATIRIPKGTHPVLADITVPSNICLKFDKGAKLEVASGKTLTINGCIEAGLWQIFSGAGTVSGTCKNECVYVDWFCAGDGATDDSKGIITAHNISSNKVIFTTAKTYAYSTKVFVSNKTKLTVQGNGATLHDLCKATQSINSVAITIPVGYEYYNCDDIEVSDFKFTNNLNGILYELATADDREPCFGITSSGKVKVSKLLATGTVGAYVALEHTTVLKEFQAASYFRFYDNDEVHLKDCELADASGGGEIFSFGKCGKVYIDGIKNHWTIGSAFWSLAKIIDCDIQIIEHLDVQGNTAEASFIDVSGKSILFKDSVIDCPNITLLDITGEWAQYNIDIGNVVIENIDIRSAKNVAQIGDAGVSNHIDSVIIRNLDATNVTETLVKCYETVHFLGIYNVIKPSVYVSSNVAITIDELNIANCKGKNFHVIRNNPAEVTKIVITDSHFTYDAIELGRSYGICSTFEDYSNDPGATPTMVSELIISGCSFIGNPINSNGQTFLPQLEGFGTKKCNWCISNTEFNLSRNQALHYIVYMPRNDAYKIRFKNCVFGVYAAIMFVGQATNPSDTGLVEIDGNTFKNVVNSPIAFNQNYGTILDAMDIIITNNIFLYYTSTIIASIVAAARKGLAGNNIGPMA